MINSVCIVHEKHYCHKEMKRHVFHVGVMLYIQKKPMKIKRKK